MSTIPSDQIPALLARGRGATSEAKRAILARLLRAWEAAPALRLGQFLEVARARGGYIPLFYVEDEQLVAAVEAFAPPAPHDLTSPEVALAKMLAAWGEWVDDGSVVDATRPALCGITTVLRRCGLAADTSLTDAGRALLDRARKAGLL